MHTTGFWAILGIGALFGTLHSTLASTRVKAWAARRLGLNAVSYYRLFFVFAAAISTLLYFASIFLFPDSSAYEIHAPYVYLSLLIQLVAGICFITALFQTSLLQFSGLAALMSRPPSEDKLRTSGFYRYTRHPLYLFALIMLWLLPRMTWNMLALAIGVTVYTLIGSLLEERRLATQFGQEYVEYKARTPWLIPIRFRRQSNKQTEGDSHG